MIMLSCSEVRFSLADIYTTPCFFFFGGGGGGVGGSVAWLIGNPENEA